ncbi:hypothetical protein BC829DRAFT_414596 [Chytridium lagenaria]|nr:hypothetical protein BC829DRAFT_414596 [Chytridium lagenaria]
MSIIMPVVKHYYDESKSSSKRLKLNFESFKEMLEDPILFHSFKEFAALDLTVENAIFLEAHKELMSQYDRCILKRIKSKRRNSKKTSSWMTTSMRNSLLPVESKGNHSFTPFEDVEDSRQKNVSMTSQCPPCGNDNLENPIDDLHDESTVNVVPRQLLNGYTKFYLNYIADGAINEVNISFKTRERLKKIRESQLWRKDDFTEAKEEVMMNLFWNVYPRWVEARQAQIGDIKESDQSA